MMVYDIILTLPVEVEKIWTKKFTGVTVLWFLVSAPIRRVVGAVSQWADRIGGGSCWLSFLLLRVSFISLLS